MVVRTGSRMAVCALGMGFVTFFSNRQALALPEPPQTEFGNRIDLKLTEDKEQSCGAMTTHGEEWMGTRPNCGQVLSTNCSLTYWPLECPKSCPFIAPNHAFSCLFQCTSRESCAESNPGRPYADERLGTCMPCQIEGCKVCSSLDKCEVCHDYFSVSADRKICTFWMDSGHGWEKTITGIKYALLGLVLFGLFWGCCVASNPHKEVNEYAIVRARRHRHLAKTLKWTMSDKKSVVEFPSIFFPVHKKNIVGVGLALFYNNIVFTILVSIVFYMVTKMIFDSSGAKNALSNFDCSVDDLYSNGYVPGSGAPAIVISRLHFCKDLGSLTKTIQHFAETNYAGMGMLYMIFFAMLVIYVKRQKRQAAEFNTANATMADYAIRISGLPKDVTDEAQIKDWIEAELRKACPGTFERPREVTDGGRVEGDIIKPREDSPIEVYGVSLCYDYIDRWADIDNAIALMTMRFEVETAIEVNKLVDAQGGVAKKRTSEQKRQLDARYTGGEEAMAKERQKQFTMVEEMFEGSAEKMMKTNGEAFVVFKYHDDVSTLWKKLDDTKDTPLKNITWPGASKPIEYHWVYCEPPSVNWQYLGEPVKKRKVIKGVAWIVFLICVMLAVVVYPYYKYVLKPYVVLGSAASGPKTMIMGIIIGNLNTFIGIQTWMTSSNCGFHRRESMDTMVLLANVFFTFVNIGFSLVVIYRQGMSMIPGTDWAHGLVNFDDLETLGVENTIAKHIFEMMMPGLFFISNLMILIMAGIWPWIFNNFLAKVIFVWKALPECLLKILRVVLPWAPEELTVYPHWRAERALEPMEIQIGDNANLIVIPTVCASLFLIMSPYTFQLFKCMAAWGVFYYFFLRYMHFRFCKKCYYTSNIVDNFVNYLWGIPLSVVAVAWVQWGYRAKIFSTFLGIPSDLAKVFSLGVVFVISMMVWCITYHWGVRPWKDDLREPEDETLTFLEVKENLFYTWFNCNPVFVLKCQYYWTKMNGDPDDAKRKGHPIACGEDIKQVRFFSIGKEYLFLKPERQHMAFPIHRFNGKPGHWSEFETYLEMFIITYEWFRDRVLQKVKVKQTQGESMLLLLEDELSPLSAKKDVARTVGSP